MADSQPTLADLQALRQKSNGPTLADLQALRDKKTDQPEENKNTNEFGSISSLVKTLSGTPHEMDLSLENVGKSARKGLIKAAQGTVPFLALEGGAKALSPLVKPFLEKALASNPIKQTSLVNIAAKEAKKAPSSFRQWADKLGLKIDTKDELSAQKSIEDYFSKAKNKASKFINPSDKEFNPIQANREISKAYDAELEHSRNLWGGVKAAWRGEKVTDNGLKKDLSDLISELRSTPEVSPDRGGTSVAVKDLENISSKLGTEPIIQEKPITAKQALGNKNRIDFHPEKGIVEKIITGHKLNVNDLIDLKKSLNSHYDSRVFRSSEDAPYIRLSTKIDQLIRQAGQKNPKAFRLYQDANDHWADEVAKRFTDNDVLKQFWKPEDYHSSYKNQYVGTHMGETVGKGIHPNTALRVQSFMSKINSPVDLEIVANSVPHQYSKVILANKFADLMTEIGMDATKLTPQKLELLEKSLGQGYGAVQARGVLNDAKEVLNMLKQRNIKAPYTEAELQRQNVSLAGRVGALCKSIVALKTGNPMSLIENAGDALTEQEKAKGAAAKMEALMKDYNKRVKKQ